MRLVLLGVPGAGKGTQASMLEKKLGVPHISTGEIFRENIAKGTVLGKEVEKRIENGELVPDDVTIELVRERLIQEDCKKGFILDGFPRTIPQAESLDKVMKQSSEGIDYAVNVDLPERDIIKRLTGRRVCMQCGETYNVNYDDVGKTCTECGARLVQRSDDDEETIRRRISNYHKKTAPLLEFYRKAGKLKVIDGRGSIDEVFVRILKVLGVCT